ncbi:hypothetical protein HGRIS_000866 [Hohenbuehelia grisea]|uniref:Uncharacterized protein n=1 Tax=Hohenbuehelia grisea TaxID=104357 RepID=A0ABR3IQ02_9AGAR
MHAAEDAESPPAHPNMQPPQCNSSRRTGHPSVTKRLLKKMRIKRMEVHPSSRKKSGGRSKPSFSTTPSPPTATQPIQPSEHAALAEITSPKGFFDLLRHVKETSSGRPSPTRSRPSPTTQTDKITQESDSSSDDTDSSDDQTHSADSDTDEETSDEDTMRHSSKRSRGRPLSVGEEEGDWHGIPEASSNHGDPDGDENASISDDGDAWFGISHDESSPDGEDAGMDLDDDPAFPSLGDKLLDSYMKEFICSPENRFLTRRDVPVLLQMLSSMLAKCGPVDETSLSTTSQKRTSSRSNEPRRQSKNEIYLKRDIRDFMRETLNLRESLIQVPCPAELKAFANTKDPSLGPDIEALRLDLAHDALHTPWNHRAIKLLTQKFLQDPDYRCKDSKRVKLALFRHFITLRFQYLTFLEESGVVEVDEQEEQARIDKARDKAKYNRMRNLRKRRMGVFQSYRRDSSMAKLLPVMESLPWTAMSGDDTDHRNDDLSYIKAHPKWRSKDRDITDFFDTLDALHLSTRFADDGRPLPGQFPHRRKKSSREELVGNVPPHLPVNFYDAKWLRNSKRREELEVQPPVDLNFSAAIKNPNTKRTRLAKEAKGKENLDPTFKSAGITTSPPQKAHAASQHVFTPAVPFTPSVPLHALPGPTSASILHHTITAITDVRYTANQRLGTMPSATTLVTQDEDDLPLLEDQSEDEGEEFDAPSDFEDQSDDEGEAKRISLMMKKKR